MADFSSQDIKKRFNEKVFPFGLEHQHPLESIAYSLKIVDLDVLYLYLVGKFLAEVVESNILGKPIKFRHATVKRCFFQCFNPLVDVFDDAVWETWGDIVSATGIDFEKIFQAYLLWLKETKAYSQVLIGEKK